MRVGIGIATKGRSTILVETVRELRLQTHPYKLYVCGTEPADVAGLENESDVTLLSSAAGSAIQRNAILAAAATECDVLLFIDDDFFPDPNYVKATAFGFESDPQLMVSTGYVIRDGIHGPGLQPAEARKTLAEDRFEGAIADSNPALSGYGCNTAVRMSVVNEHQITFDEKLPLYAWYEDLDFTRRVGHYGLIKRLHAARGVHLGVKFARSPGRRLGYSQVANPLYLWKKGTSFKGTEAIMSIVRNFSANAGKSITGDPYADRRGRLAGNLRAFGHLLTGRLHPEKILEFK